MTDGGTTPQSVSAIIGLVIDAASGSEVQAHIDIDERHHQGSGIVHGGVYAHVIESILEATATPRP